MSRHVAAQLRPVLSLTGLLAALAACDGASITPAPGTPPLVDPASALIAVQCSANTRNAQVTCDRSGLAGPNGVLIGGQNSNVKLTSSNVSYDSGTEIFQFDVTVQNLMNEAIGTPDGVVADPEGIQVFFHSGPTVTSGLGEITFANADGTGTFTGSNQPYFAYNEILAQNQVSAAKSWQLNVPATVTTFSFVVYIETDVQYLLVINEVMVNPPGTGAAELPLEWFEIYNAGSRKVQLQNLVIADSAASGRRPYHVINSPLEVAPGGYVVLGTSTNTTDNGGAPVDYAYGNAFNLANSLDAVKIARVYGPSSDTLTIDRTQYANAAISAAEGISRELKNPALDNSNMDGSNWASALVTAVYGTGGRGTPKAQNSTFTP
jgi:hypothetical protein